MTRHAATEETTIRLVSRRTLIGGTAGLATLAVAGAGYAAAQDSTPDEASGNDADATPLDQAGALIALVEADRASVTAAPDAGFDPATAEALLGFAHDLFDQASSASPTDDAAAEAQARLAAGAGTAALAARSALMAGLSPAGLPSQQAPVSRRMAATHAWITEASGAIADAGVTEAEMALDRAEGLYADAFAAYTAGRYAEAGHLDRATSQMLRTALILSGELHDHRLIERVDEADGRPDRIGFIRRHRRENRPSFEDWTTPVDVPEPGF